NVDQIIDVINTMDSYNTTENKNSNIGDTRRTQKGHSTIPFDSRRSLASTRDLAMNTALTDRPSSAATDSSSLPSSTTRRKACHVDGVTWSSTCSSSRFMTWRSCSRSQSWLNPL